MEIWIWGVGSIFYIISVVGGVVNLIDDIYGGTLPVLKNEIIDFFFARLGTGRTSLFLTSQRMPSRYGRVQMLIQSNKSSLRKMFIGDIFDYKFYCNNVVGGGAYFMYTKMGGGIHRTRRYR